MLRTNSMMIQRREYWLIFSLLALSTVALRLIPQREATPPIQPLSRMPLRLANWIGSDFPIEQRIISALGVDDYLSRTYYGEDGEPVVLYMGYYKTQRTGRTVHSPKNCLPGAGWQPLSAGREELLLPDGRRMDVNVYLVQKGLDQQLVLYWYQSHGRIVASEYWGKYYMVQDALRLKRTDAALIRISTPIYPDKATAQERAATFAKLIAIRVEALIPK